MKCKSSSDQSTTLRFTWWFTGLSGAGKTTLAVLWRDYLKSIDQSSVVIDGDDVRAGLSSDLGFGEDDRSENVRRVAEVARLLNHQDQHAIVAMISPTAACRLHARQIIGDVRFIEVFVSTPLHVCRQRDTKGLYLRAARHEPIQLIGVQMPYEPPQAPDLALDTSQLSLQDSLRRLQAMFEQVMGR